MTERWFGWHPPTDLKLWRLEKDYEPVQKKYPLVADLRNWDSPVRDQGQRGICVWFMLCAMMENIMNHLKLPFVVLDPMYGYRMVRIAEGSFPQDAGCTIIDSVKIGSKYGFPPEADWPYNGGADYDKFPPVKAMLDAKKHMISAFYSVKQDLATICTCIGADLMPVGNGIQIYDNFPMDTTTKGVIPMPEGEIQGGHGVPLVGYNLNKDEIPSPTMPGKKIPGKSAIIKNSWGKDDWGDAGYGYVPLDYILNPEYASEQVEIVREIDKP